MSTEDQNHNPHPHPGASDTPAAEAVKTKKTKTKAAILAELEAQVRKIREKRSKLLSQEKNDKRKMETKQAIIVGSWIRANSKQHWDQVVARLTRDQDREAVGLDPLPATPADSTTGGDHTS